MRDSLRPVDYALQRKLRHSHSKVRVHKEFNSLGVHKLSICVNQSTCKMNYINQSTCEMQLRQPIDFIGYDTIHYHYSVWCHFTVGRWNWKLSFAVLRCYLDLCLVNDGILYDELSNDFSWAIFVLSLHTHSQVVNRRGVNKWVRQKFFLIH